MLTFTSDADFVKKLAPAKKPIRLDTQTSKMYLPWLVEWDTSSLAERMKEDRKRNSHLEQVFKTLEFAPAQIKVAVPFIANALVMNTVENLLNRRDKVVGKWEYLDSRYGPGPLTDSNLIRYRFKENFCFAKSNRSFRGYVAPSYSPNAGSSFSASSVGPEYDGVFLPGMAVENGGFRLLLCWSGSDQCSELSVRRSYNNELIINRNEFKQAF